MSSATTLTSPPNQQALAEIAAKTPRKNATFWSRFRRHKLAVIGLTVLLLMGLIAIAAPHVPELAREAAEVPALHAAMGAWRN